MESTYDDEVFIEDKVIDVSAEAGAQEMHNGTTENVQLSRSSSVTEKAADEHHFLKVDSLSLDQGDTDCVIQVCPEIEMDSSKKECVAAESVVDICDSHVDYNVSNKQPSQKHIPNAILPLLRYQQYDSSDSSSSFQGSPCEDRNFRSDVDSADTKETSFFGQEDNEQNDILDWAKTNNHGSLQIICKYNRLCVPARCSTIKFHPLEHLHPLEFHRPDETVLHMAGSTVDLMSCSTCFEIPEAHRVLAVEEEATALSVWAVSCLCGSLRLDHVLTIFASALLEKQIMFVCSNLGILSALVLSIISLIHPYQWQSFFMPVLPNDMLDFLDAPVPFVVGVKSKTAEVQSKSGNVILVDTNKNQVHILVDVLLEGLKMFDILHLSDVYCGIYFSNFLFFPLMRSNHIKPDQVQQFSLTDLSQHSHHTTAILSPTSTTYGSISCTGEPRQQRAQRTHAYVGGARVLDFAAGVTAPVPVDTEPQHFVLQRISEEPRRGRRPNCRSHRARPPGVPTPPRGLAHALPTSFPPVTTGSANIRSPGRPTFSPLNTSRSGVRVHQKLLISWKHMKGLLQRIILWKMNVVSTG